MNQQFERENRYIVIKRSDLEKVPVSYRSSLVDPMFSLLSHLPRRECLVIESDWPEYEIVWAMIEHRMGGNPVPDFDLVLAERNAFRDEAKRLARLFDDLSKRVGFSEERCQQTGESPGDCADVLRADLDRVTAEREALQLMLNDLEEQNHSLEQRRYAEQQAREAAERRVEELEGLLLKLKDPTDEMVEAGNEAAVVEMEHDDDLRSYGWINNSDEVLSAMIEAALNPTAEAESHEA